MFIYFLCLCPLGLTIKLNFHISKRTYSWFSKFKNYQCYNPLKKFQVLTVLLRICRGVSPNLPCYFRYTMKGKNLNQLKVIFAL